MCFFTLNCGLFVSTCNPDLNLLDWSVNNHLAVALGGHVYLWNAGTGDIRPLLEMEDQEEYVSSVSWIKEGNVLAVGTSNSQVQVNRNRKLAIPKKKKRISRGKKIININQLSFLTKLIGLFFRFTR